MSSRVAKPGAAKFRPTRPQPKKPPPAASVAVSADVPRHTSAQDASTIARPPETPAPGFSSQDLPDLAFASTQDSYNSGLSSQPFPFTQEDYTDGVDVTVPRVSTTKGNIFSIGSLADLETNTSGRPAPQRSPSPFRPVRQTSPARSARSPAPIAPPPGRSSAVPFLQKSSTSAAIQAAAGKAAATNNLAIPAPRPYGGPTKRSNDGRPIQRQESPAHSVTISPSQVLSTSVYTPDAVASNPDQPDFANVTTASSTASAPIIEVTATRGNETTAGEDSGNVEPHTSLDTDSTRASSSNPVPDWSDAIDPTLQSVPVTRRSSSGAAGASTRMPFVPTSLYDVSTSQVAQEAESQEVGSNAGAPHSDLAEVNDARQSSAAAEGEDNSAERQGQAPDNVPTGRGRGQGKAKKSNKPTNAKSRAIRKTRTLPPPAPLNDDWAAQQSGPLQDVGTEQLLQSLGIPCRNLDQLSDAASSNLTNHDNPEHTFEDVEVPTQVDAEIDDDSRVPEENAVIEAPTGKVKGTKRKGRPKAPQEEGSTKPKPSRKRKATAAPKAKKRKANTPASAEAPDSAAQIEDAQLDGQQTGEPTAEDNEDEDAGGHTLHDDPLAPLDPTSTFMQSLTKDTGRGRISTWMQRKIQREKESGSSRRIRMQAVRARMRLQAKLEREGVDPDIIQQRLDAIIKMPNGEADAPASEAGVNGSGRSGEDIVIRDRSASRVNNDDGSDDEIATADPKGLMQLDMFGDKQDARAETEAGAEATERPDDQEDNAEQAAGSDEEVLYESAHAPQMRIVDGEIVVDEESVQIERVRVLLASHEAFLLIFYASQRQAFHDYAVVEERAGDQRITSASYAKWKRPRKWSSIETSLFYEGLRQFGTDFELISRMFVRRSRREIKSKWVREERENPDIITEALKRKKPVDIEFYEKMTRRDLTTGPTPADPMSKFYEGLPANETVPKLESNRPADVAEEVTAGEGEEGDENPDPNLPLFRADSAEVEGIEGQAQAEGIENTDEEEEPPAGGAESDQYRGVSPEQPFDFAAHGAIQLKVTN
ncbi:hypothetical protein EMMF5_002832 [Cystobasidiomycetes sp. EMM_F5]